MKGAISGKAEVPAPRRIVLKASDGVDAYAWHYAAADRARPAILLFHQAGSNHAEYETIAPRLATLGYHALALDQRSGGRMWGQANRTASESGKEVDYRAALPDLEAALAWPATQGFSFRSIIRGSSYSAALVFLLPRGARRRWRPFWRFPQASTSLLCRPATSILLRTPRRK
jgi:dienelactone hydrolase